MIVDSVIDAYGLSLGFHIYSLIWGILVSTGLVYLPIVLVVFQGAKESISTSIEDFNHQASLKRVATNVVSVLLVLQLALIPVIPMKFSDFKYFKQSCLATGNKRASSMNENPSNEAEVKLTANMTALIGSGDEIKAPILTYIALSVAQGVKNQAVNDMPCASDIRLISDLIDEQRISSPKLRAETQDFIQRCYLPARTKYRKQKAKEIDEKDDWPGSSVFLSLPGYYDNQEGDGMYSLKKRAGFQHSNHQPPEMSSTESGFGYPFCNEWWLGINQSQPYKSPESLSKRIKDSLKEGFFEKISNWFQSTDEVIRKALFTNKKIHELGKDISADLGIDHTSGFITYLNRLFGTVGLGLNALSEGPAESIIRLILPMLKPILLMFIIISYPIAMLFGRFQWQYIGLFNGVMMSIMLWPFFWEIAKLLDNTMADALGLGLTNIKELDSYFVVCVISSSLYVLAPLIFTVTLGWVGMVGVNNVAARYATKGLSLPGVNVGGLISRGRSFLNSK